jgi:hypothetical protein
MAQGFGQNIQTQSSRVSQLKRKIRNMSNPDDIMLSIMEVFTQSDFIPDVGKYYTFIYLAKTPDITYDQYPLIAVTGVERWGFKGLNFHWNEFKNYTWQEVAGKMHVIEANEIEYLRSLPYAKFITK